MIIQKKNIINFYIPSDGRRYRRTAVDDRVLPSAKECTCQQKVGNVEVIIQIKIIKETDNFFRQKKR